MKRLAAAWLSGITWWDQSEPFQVRSLSKREASGGWAGWHTRSAVDANATRTCSHPVRVHFWNKFVSVRTACVTYQ